MKYCTLSDFSNALYFFQPDTNAAGKPGLFMRLKACGGWRGLFDSCAEEFNSGTIQEKVICLQELCECNHCNLNELIDLFVKEYNNVQYNYILDAIPYAIHMYAIYSAEARLVMIERAKNELPDDVMKWSKWVDEKFLRKQVNRMIDEPFEQSMLEFVLQH